MRTLVKKSFGLYLNQKPQTVKINGHAVNYSFNAIIHFAFVKIECR